MPIGQKENYIVYWANQRQHKSNGIQSFFFDWLLRWLHHEIDQSELLLSEE